MKFVITKTINNRVHHSQTDSTRRNKTKRRTEREENREMERNVKGREKAQQI